MPGRPHREADTMVARQHLPRRPPWRTHRRKISDNHKVPERGWLGQWVHVRGGDRISDGRLVIGREGW